MKKFEIGEKYGRSYNNGNYAWGSIVITRRTEKTIFYKFIDGRSDDAEHRAKINHFHNAEEGIDILDHQYYAQGWGYIDEPQMDDEMTETEKEMTKIEFEIQQIKQDKQEVEEMKEEAIKNKNKYDYEENFKNRMIRIYEERAGIQHYIIIESQRTEYSKIKKYYLLYNDGWENEAWISTETCGGWDDLEEVFQYSNRFDEILKLTKEVMNKNYEKACDIIEEHEEDIALYNEQIIELNEKLENLKTPAAAQDAPAVEDEAITVEVVEEKAADEATVEEVKEYTAGRGTNEALIAAAKAAAGIDEGIVCHTYKKWQELGYQVMKGEKSKLKVELWHPSKYKNKDDEDEVKLYKKMSALFTIHQIQKMKPDELEVIDIDFAV